MAKKQKSLKKKTSNKSRKMTTVSIPPKIAKMAAKRTIDAVKTPAQAPSIGALKRRIDQMQVVLHGLMPLHLKTVAGPFAAGMNKVGLVVQDGSPTKLNAWVEDELVLFLGKASGESRPRPIGETITVTVEADGNPNQPVRIALTNTDRPLYADRIPANGTHYEGGDRYEVT